MATRSFDSSPKRLHCASFLLCALLCFSAFALSFATSEVVEGDSTQNKAIFTVLRSRWSGHPLVTQASELIAKEDSAESYWTFVDAIADAHAAGSASGAPSHKTDLDWYRWLQARPEASELDEFGLFSLSLSLRASSPQCQLFHKLSQDLLALQDGSEAQSKQALEWFVLFSTSSDDSSATSSEEQRPQAVLVKSVAELKAKIDGEEQKVDLNVFDQIHDFDHVRSSEPASSSPKVVILYADLSLPSFAEPHQLLSKLAKEGKITYILRPFAAKGLWTDIYNEQDHIEDESPLEASLQGYGVELAMKNVEYRVWDPAASKAPEQSASAQDQEEQSKVQVVNGRDQVQDDEEPHQALLKELKEHHPALAAELDAILAKVFSRNAEEKESVKLQQEQIAELGYKTVQVIKSAKASPLKLIQWISQNLPSLAPLLATIPFDETTLRFKEEWGSVIDPDQQNMMLVNGLSVDLDIVDPFSLITLIKDEIKLYQQLQALDLPHDTIKELSLEQGASTETAKNLKPKFDLFWPDVVSVINDLETHPAYARWPRKVRELLRPSWPGQLFPVAKNFFTLLLVCDPSHSTSAGEGVKLLEQITKIVMQSNVPIRIGFYIVTHNPAASSPYSEESQAKACAELDAEHCDINFAWAKALRVIHQEHTTLLSFLAAATNPSTTNLALLHQAWEASFASMSWEEAMKANAGWLAQQYTYLKAAGFSLSDSAQSESINNIVLFNGQLLDIDPDEPINAVGTALPSAKQRFQELIYHGEVDDETDLYKLALGDEEDVYPGFHPLIFANSRSPPTFFNLASIAGAFDYSSLHYLLQKGTGDGLKGTSHIVLADFSQPQDTLAALSLINSYITALDQVTPSLFGSRLSVLPRNAAGASNADPAFLALEFGLAHASSYIQTASAEVLADPLQVAPLHSRATQEAMDYLSQLSARLHELPVSASSISQSSIESLVCESIEEGKHCEPFKRFAASYKSFEAKCGLGNAIYASLPQATNIVAVVVTNGRTIALDQATATAWDDTTWDMLTRYERVVRSDSISKLVAFKTPYGKHYEGSHAQLQRWRADLVMNVISLLNSIPASSSRTDFDVPAELITTIKSKTLQSSKDDALITVNLLLDPLSAQAQKISSLLQMFIDTVPMEISLVLNAKNRGAEDKLPLNNYYRYVARPSLRFNGESGAILQEGAVFERLPQDTVMTMNVQAQAQFLIESKECDDTDLDNILLANARTTYASPKFAHVLTSHRPLITAQFQLESLLVEGSCMDMNNGGQPPRGLQLLLGDYVDQSKPHKVDTVVMSNLGYFQMKANPGLFALALAPGRSSKVYQVQSIGIGGSSFSARGGVWQRPRTGSATILEKDSSLVQVSGFTSPKITLKVEKQAGMEKEKLYPDGYEGGDADEGGMWGSFFGTKRKHLPSATNDDDKVHVFSVASGHLYERFLRIMMLSVKRTTSSPVKFWIIKNFLSPTFKRTIYDLAAEFDFEVELVQYQWPVWLRGQTEKQRKIWGYKILFLDVLFPLSLKKVIFIDADQVVRADLKELMDLDLQGAVYGFTPFCQGEIKRPETSGFRFWDSGFWRDHLHGRPYHISALFVVDLDRLRRTGAADQLRMTYDSLSRDPGSLANLDQDLPNYLQHGVPIFTLPREWLWCETWCTDESKEAAKTIDLCNNPLTKTPKLDNAIRIIPEWLELDAAASASITSPAKPKLEAHHKASNGKDEL